MADLEEWLARRTRTQGSSQDSLLRGDLQSQDLAAAFLQVLGTGENGILRVSSAIESCELHFEGGKVKVCAPSRPGKRLGECLVHLGLLDKARLDEALKLQKILYQPLGVILLDKGLATQEQIDQVAEYQAREELYALFTWRSGRFEFCREEHRDPETAARLEVMPAFECSEVLAEVDKRATGWKRFLHSLGSLDDAFAPAAGSAPAEGMSEEHRVVLAALGEGRTVREVSGETVYSLFDCARLLTDLQAWGAVCRVNAAGMIRIATSHLAQQQPRRAALTLQTLLDRGDDALPDSETALRVAELLMEAEAPRTAAVALVHAARLCQDPAEALVRARRAVDLDDRCAEALRCLQELLAVSGEPEELFEVSCRLVDALAESSRHEEALEVLQALVVERPGDVDLLQRQARLLVRLGRKGEAADALQAAAERLQAGGDRQRATTLYTQVLALDPGRKQVKGAMLRLRIPLDRRQLRLAIGGVVALLLLAIGLPFFSGSEESAETTVQPQAAHHAAAEAQRRRVMVQRSLRKGLDALRAHDLQAALGAWREADSLGAGKELVETARTALLPWQQELAELKTHLILMTTTVEDALEAARRRDQLLRELKEQTHAKGLAFARGVQQVREDPLLEKLLGPEVRDGLVNDSDETLRALAAAEAIQQEHLRAMSLDPLIEEAIRHEERHEFQQALAAYRRLLAEHPAEGELRQHFQDRAALYEKVIAELEAMDQAVKEFDYRGARQSLARLQRLDPRIPFAELTRLPLRIDSVPPGARVSLNGQPAGQTPARTTYRPSGVLRVEWQLEGFESLAQEFPPDRERVTAVLTKRADWTAQLQGTVDQSPACDDEGRGFFTDRSGRVTALDLQTGRELWMMATGDLSGLLPAPLVHGKLVLVGSLDGTFRALDRKNGRLQWSRQDLACETPPALCGGAVLLVTDSGSLVGLEADTGEDRFRHRVPWRIAGAVRPLDDQRAVLATAGGDVVCISARDGSELWRRTAGSGCSFAPAVSGNRIAAVSDDGRLVLLGEDGERLWERGGLLAPSAAPTMTASHVLVPEGQRLRSYELADGTPGPERRTERGWTVCRQIGPRHLLAGDRDGQVEVLDPASLELRYRIRGGSALRAAPATDAGGRVVLAFEDKQVLGFVALP